MPTSRQLKLSAVSCLLVEPSSMSLATTYSFSCLLRKRAWTGDRGKRIYDMIPNRKVNNPSSMKIHAQPGL